MKYYTNDKMKKGLDLRKGEKSQKVTITEHPDFINKYAILTTPHSDSGFYGNVSRFFDYRPFGFSCFTKFASKVSAELFLRLTNEGRNIKPGSLGGY